MRIYKLMIILIISNLPLPIFAHKNNTNNFKMWFFGKETSSRRHHNHYTKLFDTYAIFDFDKELDYSVQKTKQIQKKFATDMRYLDSDIKYLEEQLTMVLTEQTKGLSKSSEILDIYKQLYHLLQKKNSLISNHTQQITEIFNNTYSNYTDKIQHKISSAEKDPTSLVNELVNRYNMFLQENKLLNKYSCQNCTNK